MIGIPLALGYANLAEWLLHKHVLHNMGRKKGNFFRYHWMHHGNSRRHAFVDSDYEKSILGWSPKTKEAASLAGLAALHLPLLPVAPFFTATAIYCAWSYYQKHKRAHLDPAWAVENLPWHVDHHFHKDPDANWGVTHDWADRLLGTRKPWLGTAQDTLSGKV